MDINVTANNFYNSSGTKIKSANIRMKWHSLQEYSILLKKDIVPLSFSELFAFFSRNIQRWPLPYGKTVPPLEHDEVWSKQVSAGSPALHWLITPGAAANLFGIFNIVESVR